MFIALVVLLAIGAKSQEAPTTITFPRSFGDSKRVKFELCDFKNSHSKGIDAVQNVASLIQKLLIQENIIYSGRNWIVSPVSLAAVFAQILMGSRGQIRETLGNALSLVKQNRDKLEVHRQLGDLLRYLQHSGRDDYVLLLNGVVFLQNGFPLKETYKHALGDFYDTPIIPIDFTNDPIKSTDAINHWIKNSTENRFSDLFSLPISPNTVSIMANIVYFKGSWEIPFDPDYTRPGLFFVDRNQTVPVDFMYGEQQVLYGNTSDFQLIGLPYKSREIFLYILLPNNKSSARIAVKQFNSLASSARYENVTLILPKIKLTTTFSVKDAINKYLKNNSRNFRERGRRRRKFNKNDTRPYHFEPISIQSNLSNSIRNGSDSSKTNFFDMSGASEDVRFRIDDIFHKVSMEIDESGSELVAATSTLVDHFGSDLVLKVNEPFLFFLRHEITQVHLFWGFVANPTKT